MAPIHIAAKNGNVNRVRELLNSGEKVKGTDLDNAFISAAGGGHLPVVKLLLNRRANISAPLSNKALRHSARGGHLPVVKLLLNRGANINTRNINGMTPLLYAAYWRHSPVVKLLLNRGARFNKNGLLNNRKISRNVKNVIRTHLSGSNIPANVRNVFPSTSRKN